MLYQSRLNRKPIRYPRRRRAGDMHSIMIEPHESRPAASARHADAPAHDLEGDALHTLRSAEGMLLAGAAQHRSAR
jgi:hypothetical protein